MNHHTPKITIITVVLNGALQLRSTLDSIIDQEYPNLEIVVIDGGSIDGTPEVINTYTSQINYWISEPDHGIYHAMNKGLAKATGEWVCFMNAGDMFHHPGIISSRFSRELTTFDVVYGDSIAAYSTFKTLQKARPVSDLWKGMVCCHQAMFFKTNLIKEEGFHDNLFFSADYEMVLRLFTQNKKFLYIPEIIAVFDTGGVSNKKMVKSARSNYQIVRSTRVLTFKGHSFHRLFILQSKITELIYRFLPSYLIYAFLKWFYRHQLVHE